MLLAVNFNLCCWFQNCLILFGGTCKNGVVSNETWTFNISLRQWTLLRNGVDKPVGVTGHTATVVGKDMIVLFGYSPDRGVTNLIQVFGLGKCNVHVQGLTHFESGNFSFFIFKLLRMIIENVLNKKYHLFNTLECEGERPSWRNHHAIVMFLIEVEKQP